MRTLHLLSAANPWPVRPSADPTTPSARSIARLRAREAVVPARLMRPLALIPLAVTAAATMLAGCNDPLRPAEPAETAAVEQHQPEQPSRRVLQSASATSVRYTAVWERSNAGEIQIYGATEAQYRAKYNELWPLGWRLKLINVYSTSQGSRFTAVWQRSTEDEVGMYTRPRAEFIAKNNEQLERGYSLKLLDANIVSNKLLYTAVWHPSSKQTSMPDPGFTYDRYVNWYGAYWRAGYRLKLLDLYYASGEQRFTGVWQPSTEDQIGMYGETYDRYRAKYDELWQQGYRLEALDIDLVAAGQPRYTAIWHPSTAPEIQVYGWTYEAYRAKYDELWKLGWRLRLLKVYTI
jgi:hypothetical protein